jgi:enoyl-CoA hydratase/carnithine racemase
MARVALWLNLRLPRGLRRLLSLRTPCSTRSRPAAAAWAPWGIRLTKQGMWAALEIPSERAAIEYEDRQQIMALHGIAPPEAVSAFMEKRAAKFAD